MKKEEIYTAFALVTIMLISVLWKEELTYRRSLIGIQKPIEYEPFHLSSPHWKNDFRPDTIVNGYIGRRKPDGSGWSERHGHKIKLQLDGNLASR